MKICFLIIFLIVSRDVNAQIIHINDTTTSRSTYHFVEKMPSASYDFKQFIASNLHYPESALKHKIEGKVTVKFCINEDGHISDCQIIHGLDKECDKEALRVIESMPTWIPGSEKGKPVKVYFTLPVMFKLTN